MMLVCAFCALLSGAAAAQDFALAGQVCRGAFGVRNPMSGYDNSGTWVFTFDTRGSVTLYAIRDSNLIGPEFSEEMRSGAIIRRQSARGLGTSAIESGQFSYDGKTFAYRFFREGVSNPAGAWFYFNVTPDGGLDVSSNQLDIFGMKDVPVRTQISRENCQPNGAYAQR